MGGCAGGEASDVVVCIQAIKICTTNYLILVNNGLAAVYTQKIPFWLFLADNGTILKQIKPMQCCSIVYK